MSYSSIFAIVILLVAAINLNVGLADAPRGISPVEHLTLLHNTQEALLQKNIDNKRYNKRMTALRELVQEQLNILNSVTRFDKKKRIAAAKAFETLASKKNLNLADIRELSVYMGRIIEEAPESWKKQWKLETAPKDHPDVTDTFKKLHKDAKGKRKSPGFKIQTELPSSNSGIPNLNSYPKFTAKFKPSPTIKKGDSLNELIKTSKQIKATKAAAQVCLAKDYNKAIADVQSDGANKVAALKKELRKPLNTKRRDIIKEQRQIRKELIQQLSRAIRLNIDLPIGRKYKKWTKSSVSDRLLGSMVDDFLKRIRSQESLESIERRVTRMHQAQEFSRALGRLVNKGKRIRKPLPPKNQITESRLDSISESWFAEKDSDSTLRDARSTRNLVKRIQKDAGSVELQSLNYPAWKEFLNRFKSSETKEGGKGQARYVELENNYLQTIAALRKIRDNDHPRIMAIINATKRDVAQLQQCQQDIQQANQAVKSLVPHVIGNVAPGLDKKAHDSLKQQQRVYERNSQIYDDITTRRRGR